MAMSSDGYRTTHYQNTTKYETREKVTNYHRNLYWL